MVFAEGPGRKSQGCVFAPYKSGPESLLCDRTPCHRVMSHSTLNAKIDRYRCAQETLGETLRQGGQARLPEALDSGLGLFIQWVMRSARAGEGSALEGHSSEQGRQAPPYTKRWPSADLKAWLGRGEREGRSGEASWVEEMADRTTWG